MHGPAVFIDLSLEDQVSNFKYIYTKKLPMFPSYFEVIFAAAIPNSATTQNTFKILLVFFSSRLQAQELRKYFKKLGAEISEEKSSKGIEDDLHKIIGVCDVCFKDGDPVEIDAILNSIVSIMVSIPLDRGENIVLAFCEKLTKAPELPLAKVCLQSYVHSHLSPPPFLP